MEFTGTKHLKLLHRVSYAAQVLDISRSKAYLLVQSGEIPSVRLGKSVRITEAALAAYVERLTAEASHA